MAAPKDMNGYTTLTQESDGVYLTVFPPQGKGRKVTFEEARRELARYQVKIENWAAVEQAVQQATGKPVKIAGAPQAAGGGAGPVFVEIAEDEMSAKVTVIPPQEAGEKIPTLEEVRAALQKAGVVFGVDEGRMQELGRALETMRTATDAQEPIEMEVAFGSPVKDGEDASLEYLYKEAVQKQEVAPPGEAEDGRVDYRAVHQIENVPKGTLLTRKLPPKPGIPGKTVTGKTIEPKEGKDIEIKAGKGVIVSPENPNEFIADTDGQVIIKNDTISVLSLYEVPGDVDFKVGNIDFVGTVIIRGDVKEDFKVYAGEDLVIHGVAEACDLKAGGKLTIGGGLAGHDRAKVVCKGDANIKYIRNAHVEVGGNLTVNQAIMHSKVIVGGKVVVSGKKGQIVGGCVVAGQEVQAATIGSNFATQTEIEVGENVQLREEMQRLESDLKIATENLEKTKKGITFLKDLQTKLGGNLPPEKKELLTKLTRAQFKLMADVKALSVRKQELERQEQEAAGERKKVSRVVCTGLIHPGVKITINRATRSIAEELKYCALTEQEGEIKVGPIR